MSEKYKKVCKLLNYFEHFLVFVFAVSDCVSISAFASLVGASLGIVNSTGGLKNCAIITGIKKYKSIIHREKHDKIVLLPKTKLNAIKVLIAKALIDLYVNHDEFVSVNNALIKILQTKIIVPEKLSKID